MNIEEIRELASIMKEFSLTGIKIAEGDTVIKLQAETVQMAPSSAISNFSPILNTENGTENAASANVNASSSVTASGTLVKSPMVGVFYSSSSPDSAPFVKVGDQVKKGDVLCIIEAMKLMNEIVAEQDGEITEILAENGQLVEFSQPLFRIR